MSTCGSCGAKIIWTITEKGKRMPVDAEPAERPTGVFRLVKTDSDVPLAVSAAKDPVYISHFATCPNAAAHRRSR